MAKEKQELKNEVEKQQRQRFVEAVQEVENQHGYKVIAMLNFSQSGVYPTIGVQKVEKPEKPETKE